ncbi:hypothetical protein [Pseudoduganella sp. OTU4001]|uniref:hypothetical protein n=1 Tax=Pseudoduganella sp. OTU4001 TaxID=3043854 RepID=UPI00313CC1E0
MKDFMPIIASVLGGLVVAMGWFRTARLNRENNIHLKRLDYRIKVASIEAKDLDRANKALPPLVALIKQGVRGELSIGA